MSFGRELTEHEIAEQQQSNISNLDEDDQQTQAHQTPENTMIVGNENETIRTPENTVIVENGNEISGTPDSQMLSARITQMLNSVHKKPVLYFLVVQKLPVIHIDFRRYLSNSRILGVTNQVSI